MWCRLVVYTFQSQSKHPTRSDFSEGLLHFENSDGQLDVGLDSVSLPTSSSVREKTDEFKSSQSPDTDKTLNRDVYKLEHVTHLHKLLSEEGLVVRYCSVCC